MSELKYKKGLKMYPRITKNTVIKYVVLIECYDGHGYWVAKYAHNHCVEIVLTSEEDVEKRYYR